MGYLVVKQSGSNKSFELKTSVPAKPYMAVKTAVAGTAYLALGTSTAGTGMLVELFDALTSRQAYYTVNVKSLVGNDSGGSGNLAGLQLSTHHHEDVAVFALMAYPVFVFVVRDGREADVHAQLGGLEQ